MFEYIAGTVSDVTSQHVIIETAGMGFALLTDAFTRGQAAVGEKARLYTLMRVAEDRIMLYGFSTREKREMFTKLTMVSGVGPKVALSILSSLSVPDIISAVVADDDKTFQGVSGVGPKTAKRILLELRGKVQLTDEVQAATDSSEGIGDLARAAIEAVEALESLGYSHVEAAKAVASVKNLGDTAEDLVRLAIKRVGLSS